MAIAIACFVAVYGVIGGRLVQYGLSEIDSGSRYSAADRSLASRPDIVDRSGIVLATDIRVASLFGEPRRIVDVDEAVEELASVLPDVDYKEWHRKLSSGAGFVWLRRELTPRQQADVLALGIPGIGFRTEKRRFYPGGPVASHILGLVNIDNAGIAGIEKYVDDQGLGTLQDLGLDVDTELAPVKLSLDARVQHIVRDVLVDGMERYKAIAAGGVVLDAKTGEVVAMVSLPDYDPNNPYNALDKDRLNRMSAGTFEMGSTFKAFTTAMALDSGKVDLNDSFDASRPIQIARFTISDFHGKKRVLSVPEIFIYSSNIGTAKMADVVGIEQHREFLTRIGLLTRMETELPEVAKPTQPDEWKKLNSITISFGHGVSTTPLQTAVAAAALVNGGTLLKPTFLARGADHAKVLGKKVLDPATSDAMRYLFRLNVEKGSGRRAEVEGFVVGGKTGTAEKVVNGRYSSEKRFNAFLAAFPMDDPQYVVLAIIDEPKPEEGKSGATAGMNAAPMVREIVARSAPLLGLMPRFGEDEDALLVSY
ncbi:penicillin-binding protein 2 [Oricola cellulosilytica]|uniref:Penicillin-binding protein 2 n=2 Tax=Oricola cellulosilytica TaxID=1429082 RepID=A0A4R0PDD8_9HYPH|nr:penicillin-binding protein 2 [Oricola cellulosilytica]